MNMFEDQNNPCVLVIMPSFVLPDFSPNKVSWNLLYSQNVLFSKTNFKTRALPKLSIYKTTGT
jgi:hypothetical protein